MVKENTNYTEELVALLAKKMGIDVSKYEMSELIMGMSVELEHGSQNAETDITGDNPEETLKIVLAHLNEIPDYYTRLNKMEKEVGSVKTKDSGNDNDADEEGKKTVSENTSKRFRELCGIIESVEKKQLKNINYQERTKNILKEEIDPNKFKIIKFRNDGLGKKQSDEEVFLYKMQKSESQDNLESK